MSALAEVMAIEGAAGLVLRLEDGRCTSVVVVNHFDDAIEVIDADDLDPRLHKDVAALGLEPDVASFRWPPAAAD